MRGMKEGMEPIGFVTILLQQMVEGVMQLCDVVGDEVGQVAVLGLVPHVLDRIEVRGVGGKPFDLEPIAARLVAGDRTAARCTDQRSQTSRSGRRRWSMDFPQELRHVGRACIVVEQFVVQPEPFSPGCAGNGRHRRDAIVSIPGTLDGRVSRRSPHAPPQRLQQIATFVEKNQASLPFEALFLAAAISRGASGRWPVRCVRGLAAPASADSSRVCEAASPHSPGDTPRRTVAGSCPAPADRSSPRARIPSDAVPCVKAATN